MATLHGFSDVLRDRAQTREGRPQATATVYQRLAGVLFPGNRAVSWEGMGMCSLTMSLAAVFFE
jgi:hypothetical protein